MVTAVTITTGTGRESAALKAARIVVERRLTIIGCHRGRVTARCRGDAQTYNLGFSPDRGWWCHCECRGAKCSHLRALGLVIDPAGWEGES